MMHPKNQKRNAEIIRLRQKNPTKWSYRLLGEVFGLPHTSIIYIWQTYGLKKLSTVGGSRYTFKNRKSKNSRIH